MGKDKGLLGSGGKKWARQAAEKLAGLGMDVKWSVNKDQFADYASHFDRGQLLEDNISIGVKGPLLGVLSAHIENPCEDLFILACDLPFMNVETLSEILGAYRQHRSRDVYLFTLDGQPEPLCAIYTARGLATILAMQRKSRLPNYAMKYVMNQLPVYQIASGEEQKFCFRNINAPGDLDGQ
jgi:molybdopterin-guanine dinucleotide biosynthesis protein A